MDWNHDGKHDWQDHVFYNNVISDNDKRVRHKAVEVMVAKISILPPEVLVAVGWFGFLYYGL